MVGSSEMVNPPNSSEPDLRGRTLLVVGMYYAPENTGSAPYTTDTAEFLARCGADVHVITTSPHYPKWQRDKAYGRGWRQERISNVTVHRVPCYIPSEPSLAKRLAYECTFAAAALAPLSLIRTDAVIGTSPNLFSAALAAAYAHLRRRPLLQVVQDLVSAAVHQTRQAGTGSLAARGLATLEGRSLRAAQCVTVPTDAFRPTLAALGVGDERIVTVPNWSRIVPHVARSRREIRARFGWRDDFVVLHTGNIGYKQGLEQLVPAIRAIGVAGSIRFVILGDGNRRRALESTATGVSGLEIVDPVPDDEYLDTLQAADVLLVHEAASVHDMSLPSKLTSYFAAAKPVLLIGNRDGASAAELRRSGAGFIIEHGHVDELRATLEMLRLNPALGVEVGLRGLEYRLSNLAPEAGLTKIGCLVESILRSRPIPGEPPPPTNQSASGETSTT